MASLYAIGWRQGSFVGTELPLPGLILDSQGQLTALSGTHPAWVVASQDCDLNDWDTTLTEPLVELRARIPAADPATEWGIRSKVLRLTQSEAVHCDKAPLRISPEALVNIATPRQVITPARAVAFKTWLGRRYDRPARPDTPAHTRRQRPAGHAARSRNRGRPRRGRDANDTDAEPPATVGVDAGATVWDSNHAATSTGRNRNPLPTRTKPIRCSQVSR